MINENIFIINFNSLYEILDEIKEDLSFKIIKYDHEEDFNKHFNLDTKKSLIILKNDNNFLMNKNFTKKNFLKFSDFPISIAKMIEIINIQLIKLRFNHQSNVDIKGYNLNLNSKFFSKKNLSIRLTEKEIKIILYLNETKTKHGVLDLQKNIWGYSLDMETHTVETHIYRLRKKISNKFNDEDFILSHQNGYFIE